jgi:DNA helicase-2/ATP-dependent DNA helicase PcrA
VQLDTSIAEPDTTRSTSVDPENDDAVDELEFVETPPPAPAGATVNVNEAERRQNLAALSRLVHEYVALDPHPTGPGLLAWISTLQAAEVSTDADAVELATFHGAKGLEWPAVHVAGLEKGYVPISYAKNGAQLAEERRLLYVAVTRAQKELHLSWAAERTFGVKAVKRQPSPQLDGIQSAIDHLRRGHRPVDWQAQMVKTRAAIPKKGRGAASDPNPVDDPLFEELRAWRRTKARVADVPAYVIFNDQTLRAIAKRQPQNRAQLANISGIGPAKLERFGDEVLDLVKQAGD